MSTNSRIGYELPDHSVVSVFCHWDGYVSNNGCILATYYTNRDAVKELIDGGSMPSLHTTHLWETKAVRDEDDKIVENADGSWVMTPIRDPQPLYHTERGDELEVDHTSFDEFISGDSGEEYCYLYDLNGNWKAYKIGWSTPVEQVEIPNYVTA